MNNKGEVNGNDEIPALLAEHGYKNIEWAIPLDKETDLEGNQVPADSFWVRFKKPEGDEFSDLASVEGKLYLPQNTEASDLILFTPGFPGGNAGRFEMRYARQFIKAGYAFFTIRHNGTSLTNGKKTDEIIHCQERLDRGRERDEKHIGGTRAEGYTPEEIVNEPIGPLLSLAQQFDRVHLMGQSLGVAANFNAIRRLEHHSDVLKKIGNVVGIAGHVGKEGVDAEGFWDGMKMHPEKLAEYELGYAQEVGLNFTLSKEGFLQSMRKVAEMNSGMKVPDHVGVVLITTPEDPLIEGPRGSDAVDTYGPQTPRKLLVRDESSLGEPRPHSMLWIAPENLIRAVQVKVSGKGPHSIKLPNTSRGFLEKA